MDDVGFGVDPVGGIGSTRRDGEPCLHLTFPSCQGLPPLSRGLGPGTSTSDVQMGASSSLGCSLGISGRCLGWTKPLSFAVAGLFLNLHQILNPNLFTALRFVSIQYILLLPNKQASVYLIYFKFKLLITFPVAGRGAVVVLGLFAFLCAALRRLRRFSSVVCTADALAAPRAITGCAGQGGSCWGSFCVLQKAWHCICPEWHWEYGVSIMLHSGRERAWAKRGVLHVALGRWNEKL